MKLQSWWCKGNSECQLPCSNAISSRFSSKLMIGGNYTQPPQKAMQPKACHWCHGPLWSVSPLRWCFTVFSASPLSIFSADENRREKAKVASTLHPLNLTSETSRSLKSKRLQATFLSVQGHHLTPCFPSILTTNAHLGCSKIEPALLAWLSPQWKEKHEKSCKHPPLSWRIFGWEPLGWQNKGLSCKPYILGRYSTRELD